MTPNSGIRETPAGGNVGLNADGRGSMATTDSLNFTCTRCGKTLAGSGSLIAAFLEQPDGTPVCASDCKGGGTS